MQTKFQLATLKNAFATITKYFNKATSLSSSLNAAGHPLTLSKFTIYLLAILGSYYESIVKSITTRPNPLSSSQIFSYLLNHESCLTHQTHSLLTASSISVNSTITQLLPTSSSSNWGRGHGFYHGHGRGRGQAPPSHPLVFNPSSSSSHPTYQVCHKTGHIALSCYHHFNHSYQVASPSSLQAHYTTFSNPNTSSPN